MTHVEAHGRHCRVARGIIQIIMVVKYGIHRRPSLCSTLECLVLQGLPWALRNRKIVYPYIAQEVASSHLTLSRTRVRISLRKFLLKQCPCACVPKPIYPWFPRYRYDRIRYRRPNDSAVQGGGGGVLTYSSGLGNRSTFYPRSSVGNTFTAVCCLSIPIVDLTIW